VTRQHPHPRPLIETHDRRGEVEKGVFVDLEQLIARIMLEHVGQRLA